MKHGFAFKGFDSVEVFQQIPKSLFVYAFNLRHSFEKTGYFSALWLKLPLLIDRR